MSSVITIISVLENKGVITREEGEKLVEHINNHPQSSQLADSSAQVADLLAPANEPQSLPQPEGTKVVEAKSESTSTKKK